MQHQPARPLAGTIKADYNHARTSTARLDQLQEMRNRVAKTIEERSRETQAQAQ
jgi:hypothetical protein